VGCLPSDLTSNTTAPVFPDAGRIGGMAITSDEKIIYLAFDQGDGWVVYRGERSSNDAPFSQPVRVTELDLASGTGAGFGMTGVSDDDCEVVGFVLSRQGVMSVYRATRAR
jgi:hypothetical protein